jgi:hypothetical protein
MTPFAEVSARTVHTPAFWLGYACAPHPRGVAAMMPPAPSVAARGCGRHHQSGTGAGFPKQVHHKGLSSPKFKKQRRSQARQSRSGPAQAGALIVEWHRCCTPGSCKAQRGWPRRWGEVVSARQAHYTTESTKVHATIRAPAVQRTCLAQRCFRATATGPSVASRSGSDRCSSLASRPGARRHATPDLTGFPTPGNNSDVPRWLAALEAKARAAKLR